ncbi:MAG: rod shape-determining protein RodA [Acidobacteriota bacterium]
MAHNPSLSGSVSRIVPRREEPIRRRFGLVDWRPLLAALALAAIGVVTIASAASEWDGSYARRQLVWVVLGTIALLVVLRFDYRRLVDQAPLFYGIGLALLVLVLFVGEVRGGAKSWLAIGPFGGQPSEAAKLATALMLARYLSAVRQAHLDLRQLLGAGLIVAVPMVLIALERDLGGAAMYVPMLAGAVLVAGVRWRVLVVAGLLGLVFAAGFWSFAMKPYQRARIVSFLSPDADPLGAGYQVRQSKIAVGSGQWAGRGYGEGTQSRLRFLPERHTDFIMAVLAEEWGFFGVATVLLLYAVYLSGAARIASRSRDRAGILIVVALVSTLAFHALYNASMVIGLLPITGIPMPFLSYGGSFTLMTFIATGFVINVDLRRYVNR